MTSTNEMYALAHQLLPVNRSLTGDGVRKTLHTIKEILPEMKITEVASGTQAFDWTVPEEWNIKEAYIENDQGQKIIDFSNNNLHVVGYSEPIDISCSLEELQKHLYSLPDQPTAIPYITSYYKRRWGFCLTEMQRNNLKPGNYKVKIDSELKQGFLTYGEIILPGNTPEEVLLSTYVCHPSMANNELSGPVVTTEIVKWLKMQTRKYTYRILFIPETIGSIVYLSQHWQEMKQKTVAGFVITCIGDNRNFSILRSRKENTLADKIAVYAAKQMSSNYKEFLFTERGSDERQYCSPGIDLPVCCLMRTKFGEYPEYHTSLDNFDVVTPEGLQGGFEFVKTALNALEINATYLTNILCEPQLGKRGLYPDISTKESKNSVRAISDLIAYSDGQYDLIDISNKNGISIESLSELSKKLVKSAILRKLDH